MTFAQPPNMLERSRAHERITIGKVDHFAECPEVLGNLFASPLHVVNFVVGLYEDSSMNPFPSGRTVV